MNRHAPKSRTANDQRADLATYLVLARKLDPLEVLVKRFPKIPAREIERLLGEAGERRDG